MFNNLLGGSTVSRRLKIGMLLRVIVCLSAGIVLMPKMQAQAGSAVIYRYVVPAGGYDAVGNLTQVQDSINGNATYTYDSLNRLTGGTVTAPGGAPQNLCWTYDSFGNRTSQMVSNAPTVVLGGLCSTSSQATYTQTVAHFDDGTNRITAIGNPGIPVPSGYYEPNSGNIQNDGIHTYLYDEEGRLCAVLNPSPTGGRAVVGTQYIYDAEGRRVAKGNISQASCDRTTNGFSATDAATRTYVLDQTGNQVTEMDGQGNWQHTNVFAAGQMLATYDQAGLHFNVTDALGTKRLQASATGQAELNCLSLPYGDGDPCIQTSQTAEATEQRFTGKERDQESGLDYFGARYYASSMGRFMSPDWAAKAEPVPYAKLDHPQSLNLYAYVKNNPLSMADPDGHCCWDWFKGHAESAWKTISYGGIYSDKSLNAQQRQAAIAQAYADHPAPSTHEVIQTTIDIISIAVLEPQPEMSSPAAEVPTVPEGSFSIHDWSGYPEGAPQPTGPFRLLEGEEYSAARSAANKANRALRQGDPEAYAGQQIHEIQPVKFGGSPTDAANKVTLSPAVHQQFTNWWNSVMNSIKY